MKKRYYKPNVIMSIHGYNSVGKWQDNLTLYLNELNLKSAPYKYGRKIFGILPRNITKEIEKFRNWYFAITDNSTYELQISEPFHRPSIIAHSLGTWILVKTLQKYPEVKFDKLFLLGSIIPSNYDWFKLILRGQVNSVIYEKADRDKIAPLGLIFTGSLYPCGTKGFVQKSSFIKEESFPLFGHSDFDYKAHVIGQLSRKLNEEPHQLAVQTGRDLTEKIIAKYFVDTERIDQVLYSAEYNQNPILRSKAIDWFRIEKDIWSFVVNSYTQKPLAYINAVPVNDNTYNKFCSGEISESDLSCSDILDYDICPHYNLLILSIAIKRSAIGEETTLTKGRIAEILIMSSLDKIGRHNSNKFKLKKIAAFAWSEEGKKLCQGFCMKKVSEISGHFLYELDMTLLESSDLKEANFMAKWWFKRMLRW